MNESRESRVSEVVRQRFVGRAETLDIFYLRLAYRHAKNGVYYYGAGGLGKTWILKKIQLDSQEDPTLVVTDIIDFFNTQNHNIRGLQASIKSCLQAPEAFQSYDEELNRLETIRSKGEEVHPSEIVSLEARVNRQFIECCQQATIGREVVLLFDTFERVQHLDVGRWMIQEFLPKVRSVIVAIAGRPAPDPAQMSDNVVVYKLRGLGFEETQEYIKESLHKKVSEDLIRSVWIHTGGTPLLIDLIFDLPVTDREPFIAKLNELEDSKRVQDSPDLLQRLVGQFTKPDKRNRVIWVMAYFKRRFDVQMLKHIAEKGDLFRRDDYRDIFDEFSRSIYIKEYPEQQSHLLHDEVQRMVADYVLKDLSGSKEILDPLYDLIVNHYYPDTIATADPALARQMQAEQVGYFLDKNPNAGFEKYKAYRDEIEDTYEYDFEELLWSEVREHLKSFDDDKRYQICDERGQFLRRHNLFQKAEEHYRQMRDLFKDHWIKISQSLGFMAMRQGNIEEAKSVFEQSLELVKEDDFKNIAMIENNLAQAAIASGEWDLALRNYAHSLRAATMIDDYSNMCGAYIGRGYLYSLQGLYSRAKQQCELAIKLVEYLPDDPANAQRAIFAWMNLGTAYRHSGDYQAAASHYEKSLELARKINHREGICHTLQHIGVNEHLWGKRLLQKQENLTRACEYQLHALQHLTEALKIAQESDWREAIAHGLHRLAHIYDRIDDLQILATLFKISEFEAVLHSLQQEAQTLQIPFRVEYEYDLLMPTDFVQLGWQEKTAWLFEVSAILADEVNNFHLALDSLTELASLFVRLGIDDKVSSIIRRIERIKGFSYQEELFSAMSEISLADLEFKQRKLDAALERYEKAYAKFAGQSGYASYLLADRLKVLEIRLRALPPNTALEWCNVLGPLALSISTVHPEMLELIENIRFDIKTKKLKRIFLCRTL